MYMYHAWKVRGHSYVLGISICTIPGKCGVRYIYHARKVSGHVYVPCQESEGSCICLRNINMYHARKVRGDVYVPCQESEESCICTMPEK